MMKWRRKMYFWVIVWVVQLQKGSQVQSPTMMMMIIRLIEAVIVGKRIDDVIYVDDNIHR